MTNVPSSPDPWTVISAIASAVSAIFAAVAAWISYAQIRQVRVQKQDDDRRETIERAFDHSVASSEMFFKARQKLSKAIPPRNAGNPVTHKEADVILSDPELVDSFNYILNHYGRMASAYRYGLIDKTAARNLHRFGFLRFWNTYKTLLDTQFESRPESAEQYADSRALYEEWK